MSSHRQSSAASGGGRHLWRLVSLLAALVGLGCVAVWFGQAPFLGASKGPVVAEATVSAAAPTHSVIEMTPDSRPVHISIPAAEVEAVVGHLGLQRDGTVEVPSNPDHTGWFRLGARPGEVGSSVILGHVDSAKGPAVFAQLKTLRVGHKVRVKKADGTSSTFRVFSVATYPNAEFPAKRVYGKTKGRWLTLVTCGGAFDANRGGYQANVVVYTRLVKPSST